MFPQYTVNCSTYNSSSCFSPPSLGFFCLSNGTTLKTVCQASEAVCNSNGTIQLDDSFASCRVNVTTTNPTTNSNNNNNNTASVMTPLLSLTVVTASMALAIPPVQFLTP
ncbi:circularly permutated Ras protein 2-like [Aplysia californica]|uniref:Circularly permutated Ras protein 2-like n=1 Tax=Aplysia californica TaxID=6500 RepID=A0ABM1A6A7_APLCA|nr:circularly permutated Ras protein 2-like [Aplysia californica]